jgi:hypothetical protein
MSGRQISQHYQYFYLLVKKTCKQEIYLLPSSLPLSFFALSFSNPSLYLPISEKEKYQQQSKN